jgi:hypothetical protein
LDFEKLLGFQAFEVVCEKERAASGRRREEPRVGLAHAAVEPSVKFRRTTEIGDVNAFYGEWLPALRT